MVKKDVAKTIRRWEEKNLAWGLGYYDKWKGSNKSLAENMATRGYDAYRISPQITKRFGLRYRAVYGATVEPSYVHSSGGAKTLKDRNGKYIAKVRWHKQGYVKAGKRSGTFLCHSLSGFSKSDLNSKLMRR